VRIYLGHAYLIQ